MTPDAYRRMRWAAEQEDLCREAMVGLDGCHLAEMFGWPAWTWEPGPLHLLIVLCGPSAHGEHFLAWPEDQSRN